MRVLHVITGLSLGGAESMLLKLASRLHTIGVDQNVVSLMSGGELASEFARIGVPVSSLGMRRGVPSLIALRDLRRAVCAYRPQVVHGWMYHANILASMTTPASASVIWGIRQTLYDAKKERLNTRLVIAYGALAARKAKAVVYNSALSARQHEQRGYPSARSLVIPNGFDLDAFWPDSKARSSVREELGLRPDAIVFGHVARFHPMKNHEGLITSFACVAKANPHAVLVMAGDNVNDYNRTLGEVVLKHRLVGRIRMIGKRRDVAKLMNGFDVYVSASSWGEGFPNVLGEALACGVPCIATDIGDSRDIVAEHGWLVDAGNSDQLSQAMLDAARLSAGERKKLGALGRKHVESRYSLDAVAKAHRALYASVGASG